MKNPHFLFPLAAISIASALGFSSCKKGDGETIRIGEFASLTGKEATFGMSSHEGTLLAIEEFKAIYSEDIGFRDVADKINAFYARS